MSDRIREIAERLRALADASIASSRNGGVVCAVRVNPEDLLALCAAVTEAARAIADERKRVVEECAVCASTFSAIPRYEMIVDAIRALAQESGDGEPK